jgi:diadenosine tetraphosphatase ApaH/serine/threonine PP2A family protein phosphatase
MVHASPTNPDHWDYILTAADAAFEMQAFQQPLCFVGHSHIPEVFTAEQKITGNSIRLNPEQKYVINVGSVGQPRDRNPKACYCIYHPGTRKLEYIRVPYDTQKTFTKIMNAGLPAFLANRLLTGY